MKLLYHDQIVIFFVCMISSGYHGNDAYITLSYYYHAFSHNILGCFLFQVNKIKEELCNCHRRMAEFAQLSVFTVDEFQVTANRH